MVNVKPMKLSVCECEHAFLHSNYSSIMLTNVKKQHDGKMFGTLENWNILQRGEVCGRYLDRRTSDDILLERLSISQTVSKLGYAFAKNRILPPCISGMPY